MKKKHISHLMHLNTHKKILMDSCLKLAIHFIENEDDEEFALMLMKRAYTHDLSKLSEEEFSSMDAFESNLKFPQEISFSEDELIFLKRHWSQNRHHPEFWNDINDMEDIDIAEMVCDWHARSVEFNTDLMEYIEFRQANRFCFPDEIYGKILSFGKILTQN